MTLSNKKVIVFDFDGTVVDSMDEFADIAAKVISETYATPLEEARRGYMKTSGVPFFEQLEMLYPNHTANAEASQTYETRKAWTYLQKKAFSDVPAALTDLQKAGYQTVVSSNNFQELVDQLVERLELPFDLVLGFKPDFSKGEAHFRFIRNHFKCTNDDILFVGDSLHDFKRAIAEGVDFVGRTGTFTPADFEAISNDVVTVDTLNGLTAYLADNQAPTHGTAVSAEAWIDDRVWSAKNQ